MKASVRTRTIAGWDEFVGVVVLLALMTCATEAVAQAQGRLRITNATRVDGRSDTLLPSATIANLKGAGWVAGNTLWDNDGDGLFDAERRVGFAWSQATGMLPSELSKVDFESGQYTHRPIDLNPDGAHVGFITFRDTIDQLPYLFRPDTGFAFLPLPRSTGGPPGSVASPVGFARGISDDGMTAVGTVADGPFVDSPSSATVWSISPHPNRATIQRTALPSGTLLADAWAVSADGTVVVGDAGPDLANLVAMRWIGGSSQPLQSVGTASTARLVSADGSTSVGWAAVNGSAVLVRWDASGIALIATPPAGTRIESLSAITPDGSTVCGALSADDVNSPFGENWAPFVWSAADGYVVIPENGREGDYDLSVGVDLSDDGHTVVGTLQSSIVFNGDPPTLGFIWTRTDGLLIIDDLLAQSGLPQPSFLFRAYAVSGDGLRVAGNGEATGTVFDTNAYVLDLVRE